MHHQWHLLHWSLQGSDSMKYFLHAVLQRRYLQWVLKISKADFDLFFKCWARRLNLSIHHYLFVKNIFIPAQWTCLPAASSHRSTHPHCSLAAKVINPAWQHISSFLSVCNNISRLMLQKWLNPHFTSLHTHAHTNYSDSLCPCRERFTVSRLSIMAPS